MRALMVTLILGLSWYSAVSRELPSTHTPTLGPSTQSKEPEPPQDRPSEDLQFNDMGGGKALRHGIPLSIHWWRSSDGVPVTSYIESHRSPQNAERAMQKKVQEATKLISRGAKLNRSGNRVGERAVVRLPLGDGRHHGAAILWTDGSEFHHLESPSLKHVLAFEKSFLGR